MDRRSLDAIAHPARREVIDLLAEQGTASVTSMLMRTRLSPSALSQHLRVLKDAGLVRDERTGNTAVYILTPEPLVEIVDWMLRFQRTWSSYLDALGTYLDSTTTPARPSTKSRRK
jgi:DNA-binding transcriptional ArsR family regulator